MLYLLHSFVLLKRILFLSAPIQEGDHDVEVFKIHFCESKYFSKIPIVLPACISVVLPML